MTTMTFIPDNGGGSFFSTGDTVAVTVSAPRKEPGFCDAHGIAHAWVDGPTLMSYPGFATRKCENCGKSQRKSLGEQPWEDN